VLGTTSYVDAEFHLYLEFISRQKTEINLQVQHTLDYHDSFNRICTPVVKGYGEIKPQATLSFISDSVSQH
jgi:hypothetical protein